MAQAAINLYRSDAPSKFEFPRLFIVASRDAYGVCDRVGYMLRLVSRLAAKLRRIAGVPSDNRVVVCFRRGGMVGTKLRFPTENQRIPFRSSLITPDDCCDRVVFRLDEFHRKACTAATRRCEAASDWTR